MKTDTILSTNPPAFTNAIRKFNAVFGYELKPEVPYSEREVAALVELAELRGRPDLARVLKQAAEVVG